MDWFDPHRLSPELYESDLALMRTEQILPQKGRTAKDGKIDR
jgi:hypothetical protein